MVTVDVQNVLFSLLDLLQLLDVEWGLGVVLVLIVQHNESIDKVPQLGLNFSCVDGGSPNELSRGARCLLVLHAIEDSCGRHSVLTDL